MQIKQVLDVTHDVIKPTRFAIKGIPAEINQFMFIAVFSVD